jgi:acyl-CoA hydrolase
LWSNIYYFFLLDEEIGIFIKIKHSKLNKRTMMDNAKTVNYSRTTITELMIPSYANFGGKIHGGILLSLMDKVAYVCAAKHSGTYVVTVSVDNVEFRQPVEVGELVSLHASVNYVGNSSLIVGIKVVAENIKTASVKHTNTSYFTMVAKDENGKLASVPPLILESDEDIRRFLEALKRKEIKSSYKELLHDAKTCMEIDENLHLLDTERCIIKREKDMQSDWI